jgi:4-hydroxy-3-methylbut-2-en-1-yl diphosphate synthase IspG/GcpE
VLTPKPLQRLTERWDFLGVASVELAAVMVTGSQPRTTGSAKILHFVRIDVSVNATTERFEKILVCALWCALQPGEMADADYGYVGAGVGRISLYKGKVCVQKNIPENEAVERLVELIKENGDWKN